MAEQAGAPEDEMIDVHVLRKYKVQAKLGKGAYGVVWQAVNKKTKRVVALKKIFGAFQNKTDAQRTFREVILLSEFQHDNIIRLLEVMKAMNDKDIYLVFEFMEADLHETIRAGVLSDAHNQYIMYQLLKAINFMHKACVLHRDLKPGNILINSDCFVKVCDLGLARLFVPKPKPGEPVVGGAKGVMMTSRDAGSEVETNDAAALPMTENIATRWYCAPEILVGSSNYSTGVDMWAIGCILGELLAKKTIFPGNNTVHQLELIVAVTGPPTRSDIESMHCPAARSLLMNIKPSRGISLEKRLKAASPDALDLLRRLIVFNPEKRLTCAEAMAHPWLKNFFDEKDVEPGVPDIHMIDNQSPTAAHYRKQLYTFIDKMQEELAVKEAKEVEQRKKMREGKKKGGRAEGGKAEAAPKEAPTATASASTPALAATPSGPTAISSSSYSLTTEPEKKKKSTRLTFLPRKGVAKAKKGAPATTGVVPMSTTAVSEPLLVKKIGHIGIDSEGNFNFASLPPELLSALQGEIPPESAPAPPQSSTSATESLISVSKSKAIPISKSKSSGDVSSKLSSVPAPVSHVPPSGTSSHHPVPSGATSSRTDKTKRISLFFGAGKKEEKKFPRSRSFEDVKEAK